MLRRIARGSAGNGGDGVGGSGGREESKDSRAGSGVTGGAISSEQLLDAVNDILGRADMSLSMEQGEQLKETLRLKGEDLR